MPTTHYIWDVRSDCYLSEKDENDQVTAVYTNEPVPYGRLISQRRGGQTRYHHYDGQHSTRQLTDENGNVTDTATYTAFGKTVAKTGPSMNPFRYKGALGYYANPETGDVYVRRRTLYPAIARWLAQDPAGHKRSGFLRLYAYAYNNPLNKYDPSGAVVMDDDENGEKYPPAPLTFTGCTKDESKRIKEAFESLCKYPDGHLWTCEVGQSLKTCFGYMCLKATSSWDVECKTCKDKEADAGGGTIMHHMACFGVDPCVPQNFKSKEIFFCRGQKAANEEKGRIPKLGYELEQIWLHEMLHNCCLKHEPDSPQWQQNIFGACVNKCLKGKVRYVPDANPNDCKCPDC